MVPATPEVGTLVSTVPTRRGSRRSAYPQLARAHRDRHGLLLPSARRHHRTRARAGNAACRARTRGDRRHRVGCCTPRQWSTATSDRCARSRSRSSAPGSRCRCTATTRRPCTPIPPLLWESLRILFRRRQFDVMHVHAPYNPSFATLAPLVMPKGTVGVGTYHSVFSGGLGLDALAPADALVVLEAARARRRLRGLHRLAGAVLPVLRVARDPERDRRAPLHARRRSDPRAPRRRQAGDPVPRALRPAQRARHDAARVRARAPRALGQRAPRASSATGRCAPTTSASSTRSSRATSSGPAASTGRARATTPRPTCTARRATAPRSGWCCSRR